MALFNSGTKKKPGKNVKVGLGGKLKKQSKPKLAFLSLAALLFLTSTGYAGFSYYKQNQLKAQAAGWTYLTLSSSNPNILWMRACKTLIPNTYYGDLYKVNYQVYRKNSKTYGIVIEGYRNSSKYGEKYQGSWLYGVVAGTDFIVSKNLRDFVRVYAISTYSDGSKYPTSGKLYNSFNIFPGWLADC